MFENVVSIIFTDFTKMLRSFEIFLFTSGYLCYPAFGGFQQYKQYLGHTSRSRVNLRMESIYSGDKNPSSSLTSALFKVNVSLGFGA